MTWSPDGDVLNDFTVLNASEEPETIIPSKMTNGRGRGRAYPIKKEKRRPKPNTMVDPRTGEEIDLDELSLDVDETPTRGRGRATDFNSDYLLQKQLRMARPLGSSDDIIEAYFGAKQAKEKSKFSSDSAIDNAFVNLNRYTSSPESPEKPKPRVKGVRNSTSPNNALIEALLKSKTDSVPEKEEATGSGEPKVSDDKSNKDCTSNLQKLLEENLYHSSSSSIRKNIEEIRSLGRASNSLRGCIRGGKLIKKYAFKNDSLVVSDKDDSVEDLDFNLSLNTKREEEKGENEEEAGGIDRETKEREEKYRKLGERMHKEKIMVDNRNLPLNYLAERNPEPPSEASDFDLPFGEGFSYRKVDFPPLSKKSK